MNRRFPGDRADGGHPRRDVDSRDDSERSGFGGSRFGNLALPIGETNPGAGEAKAPFGGSGWQAFDAPSGLDDDDLDENRGRRKRPPPPTHPRKTLAALGATVRVTRDDAGIPHIAAKSERDAYAALGFCMAEDRLWQIDFVRRLATGRAAEILGTPYAHHDALVRTAGVPRRAAAVAAKLSGGARDALAAFTSGVNAARAEGRPPECQALGYEIEPWTIADSLAIELLLAWTASLEVWPAKLVAGGVLSAGGVERARWIAEGPLDVTSTASERGEALRLVDAGILDLVAGLPIDLSTHGTAVGMCADGESGAALVAGEIALAPMLPVLAYLAHLEAPGISLAGVALLGGVMFPLARNRGCAWATAAALVDDADCVLEEIDGIGSYRTEAGWSKLSIRHELVRVRGAESLKLEVAETRNGPLVSRVVDQLAGRASDARIPALAIRWGAQSLESGVPGWLALARARSLSEVAEAARLLDRGPIGLQMVAGDADGALGRFATGKPESRGASFAVPVLGWVPVAGGKGIPESASPPALASAAVVAVASARAGVPGVDRDASTTSLTRLDPDALGPAGRTLEALLATLLDPFDPTAAAVAPVLVGALRSEAAGSDPALARIAELLDGWDHKARPESAAAAVYYLTALHFLPVELFSEARFAALLRRPETACRAGVRLILAGSSAWLPEDAHRERAAVAAVRAALGWLGSTCGPDALMWTFSAVVDAVARHPLAEHEEMAGTESSRVTVSGSPFAVRCLGLRGGALPLRIAFAPAARIAADLATDEIRVGLAGGESGRSGSRHLLDLAEEFQRDPTRIIRLTTDVQGDLTELVSG